MKKKIISGLMIVVVVVLAYFYAHIDKNSYIYDRDSDTSTFLGTGILEEGEELTQTFVVDEDTIDGINLKIYTSGSVENIILHYALIDEATGEIFESTVPGSELENNKFNQLDIPTITGTEGKTYTLLLSEENSDELNGIGFYVEPGVEDEQRLTIKENETDGNLVARIICHRFDTETFVVLLGMVAFVVVFMKVLYKMFK